MQLLAHITLVLLYLAKQASAASVAKHRCHQFCGDVRIPYPFGVGPHSDCYINEWFHVECDNSTSPHTPFLSSFDPKLEVRKISVDGRLWINNPVHRFNYTGVRIEQYLPQPNLTGSPFVYSQEHNIFTASSCGFFAAVRADHGLVGGCMSTCESFKVNHCVGINCCQTILPEYLSAINIELQSESKPEEIFLKSKQYWHTVNYAFLAETDWTMKNFHSVNDGMDSVPVVLLWRLSIAQNSSAYKAFETFIISEIQDTYIYNADGQMSNDPSPYCALSDGTSYSNYLPIIECSCHEGFGGNPYLLKTCQDIDECKIENSCRDADLQDPGSNVADVRCHNFAGGYSCYSNGVKCDFYPGNSSLFTRKNCYVLNGEYHTPETIRTILFGIGMCLSILTLLSAWYAFKHMKATKNKRLKHMFFKQNNRLLLDQQLLLGEINVERIKLFTTNELEKSTDNFSINRILGYGGQATVYKGMLADGKIVAIKKSKMVDECTRSQFINEVVILSQIKHRNVVKLLGYCLETDVPLLVYEFIPNGTLFQYIHEHNEEFPLTWEMRMRIAREVAGALSYLHATASCPIFHRDIKSSNILLDAKYRAKIADFGTSRSVAIDQTHLTTLVQGTFGYLDPEYFQSNKFTEKSDVYSFGVVLVELLTGQKPVSGGRLVEEEEYTSLVTYFISSMEEDRLYDVVDAGVLKENCRKEIMVVAKLAKKCLNLNGKKRPSMREIITVLEAIQRMALHELKNPDVHGKYSTECSKLSKEEFVLSI